MYKLATVAVQVIGYVFVRVRDYIASTMSQWRQRASNNTVRRTGRSRKKYSPSSSCTSASAAVPAWQNIQSRAQNIITLKSEDWNGLEIRFGRSRDSLRFPGFTMKVDESRLPYGHQSLYRLAPILVKLNHSVAFHINSENGRLEAKETCSSPNVPRQTPRITVSRTVWIHSGDFMVLHAGNLDEQDAASADFTIRIMVKPGAKFRLANVRLDYAFIENTRIFEDVIPNMRYLEMLIPGHRKKDDSGELLFDEVRVRKALAMCSIRSADMGKNRIGRNDLGTKHTEQPRARVLFPSPIRVSSPTQSTDHLENGQDATIAVSKIARSSSNTLSSIVPVPDEAINLISEYKQPHPTDPKSISRCAAGADLGPHFESMSIDDKLILLDKKIRDVAIPGRLPNALLWIEGYERAVELDESDFSVGKGYVNEQSYVLGQLGCPYPVVDLLYVMARCRLEKKRGLAVSAIYTDSW